MSERDFVYWLNGFLELSGAAAMDEEQVRVVRDHLSLVLQKKTTAAVSVRGSSSPPALIPEGGVKCEACGCPSASIEGGVCDRCRRRQGAAPPPGILDVPASRTLC